MDCDTTGIEPDFALVKFKKLAGGGYFKIINRVGAAGAARARLHRGTRSTRSWPTAVGHGTLERRARRSTTRASRAKGFDDDELAQGRRGAARPPSTSTSPSTSARARRRSSSHGRAEGRPRRRSRSPDFDLLAHLGFTARRDRRRPTSYACGTMTHRGRAAPRRRSTTRCSTAPTPCGQARHALSIAWKAHIQHDGGGAAVHHRARSPRPSTCRTPPRVEDMQGRLHAVVEADAQGHRPLPRRLQAVASRCPPLMPATTTAADGRARRAAGAPTAASRPRRDRSSSAGPAAEQRDRAARPPHGLHAEGEDRRPQGLSCAPASTRTAASARSSSTCTRKARRFRSLHQQLRDRRLARPAVRRAARGVRRRLHLHPLRAQRASVQRPRQRSRCATSILDYIFRELALSLPRPHRPRPCRSDRERLCTRSAAASPRARPPMAPPLPRPRPPDICRRAWPARAPTIWW
ncbi:MAG: hypothetical protein MZV49_27380 [Rhodopseudomonas palustris]|nr:hypothetical protein [Rhodopseudomonas palustris]